MSAFPKTRHAIWRLRRAWTEYQIAEMQSKLRSLKIKLWRIDNQEPLK